MQKIFVLAYHTAYNIGIVWLIKKKISIKREHFMNPFVQPFTSLIRWKFHGRQKRSSSKNAERSLGLGNHQKAPFNLGKRIDQSRHLFFLSRLNDDNGRRSLWHRSRNGYAHFIGTFFDIKSVITNWVCLASSKKIKNIVRSAAAQTRCKTMICV
jgi:hypothetical protein